MCWEVQIVVNLQKDTPENRASLDVIKTDQFEIVGDFPKFELWKNGCACDLIQDARGKIIGLSPTVDHFLAQSVVKSVDVFWFWLEEEPEAPPLEKIEFSDFCRRSDTADLKQDTVYRVYKTWSANNRMHGTR